MTTLSPAGLCDADRDGIQVLLDRQGNALADPALECFVSVGLNDALSSKEVVAP